MHKKEITFSCVIDSIESAYFEALSALERSKRFKVRDEQSRARARIRVRVKGGKFRVYAEVFGRERSSIKGQLANKIKNIFGREGELFLMEFKKAREAAKIINTTNEALDDFILGSEIYFLKNRIDPPSKANRLEYLSQAIKLLLKELEEIEREAKEILSKRFRKIFFARSRISPLWGVMRIDVFIKNKKGLRIALREPKKIKHAIFHEVDNSFLPARKRESYVKCLFATVESVQRIMSRKREIVGLLSIPLRLARTLKEEEVMIR